MAANQRVTLIVLIAKQLKRKVYLMLKLDFYFHHFPSAKYRKR